MTRDDLVRQTRALIAEGERLQQAPSLAGLRAWLEASDRVLATAWGAMDRYHLAWLSVGRPADAPRGRRLTADEEVAYVRDVAAQKTAALRMSLRAVESGMPFLGETADASGRPASRPG
ncbi:MAG: hypothetical protein ACXWN5_03905 [Candidatus Limnocylindrales bacterium]